MNNVKPIGWATKDDVKRYAQQQSYLFAVHAPSERPFRTKGTMTIDMYTEDEVRLIIDGTRLEEAKKHEAIVATLEQENRQLRARNERLEFAQKMIAGILELLTSHIDRALVNHGKKKGVFDSLMDEVKRLL